MSRRHITPSGGEPLPPYSENLVFWAPLTEGDLTDHVSGASMSVNSGTVTWDTSGGYKCVGPLRNNTYIAAWNELSLGFDITNLQFTTTYEIFYFSSPYTIPVCLGGRTFAQNIDLQLTNYKWQRIANVLEPYDGVNLHYSHQYVDGIDKNRISRGTSPITGNVNTNVRVELNTTPNYGSRTYIIRDIRIYNRALTASEVAQL